MTAASWVLLRGLTRDRRHWGEFPERLRAALSGAGVEAGAVVAPDLAGNGLRWRETSPTTVAAMVEDARAQVLALGLRPPLRLLAMSLGAMVAIEWARRYPQELAGVVLINTSVRPLSPLHHRLRPGAWPTVLGGLLRPGDGVGLQRRILTLTSQRWRPEEAGGAELLAQWVAWQRACPVQPANALRQLWAAARYRAPRQRPAVPIRVLNGAGDRLVHPACSEALARAWALPLLRHPDAGHDLPLDDPDWVLSQVSDAMLASPAKGPAGCST